MPKAHNPRRGSMQFWPRKRTKSIRAKVKSWPLLDRTKLLGFPGYKVGMTHLILNQKGQQISCPVTVIECPPLKPFSLRFYQKTDHGLQPLSNNPTLFDDIKLVIKTQPKLTTIGKKKPEILEIALSGNKDEKIKLAKELLNKEIKISDIFKEGQQVDIHSVTKGKGYQGPVKRFGVQIRQHKSEKTKRGPASLGSWKAQGKIMYRVAHAGQMGYYTRTEYNKQIIKIGTNPKEINVNGGFLHYGLVKNDYILLKGSVPGPAKRLITLVEATRSKKTMPLPQINYISLGSKQ